MPLVRRLMDHHVSRVSYDLLRLQVLKKLAFEGWGEKERSEQFFKSKVIFSELKVKFIRSPVMMPKKTISFY